MRLERKSTLIVGGSGFIGSSVASRLLSLGHAVDILDTKYPRSQESSNQSDRVRNIFIGDVRNRSLFEEIAPSYTHIIHAAGVLGIERVASESLLTLDVNVSGTLNVLDFAKRNAILEKIVFLSTSEIYGPDSSNSKETDSAVIPDGGYRWCYASSKLTGEWLTRAFFQEHNVPSVIVRPFNVYGPLRTGSNAVTKLLQAAITDRPIFVSGDGTQSRSWCYIDDFVDGLLLTLFSDVACGEAFNIGNPAEILSISELAAVIRQSVGSCSSVVCTGRGKDDVKMRSPCIDKARDLLGFVPRTGINEGVSRTADWVLSRQHRFHPVN